MYESSDYLDLVPSHFPFFQLEGAVSVEEPCFTFPPSFPPPISIYPDCLPFPLCPLLLLLLPSFPFILFVLPLTLSPFPLRLLLCSKKSIYSHHNH